MVVIDLRILLSTRLASRIALHTSKKKVLYILTKVSALFHSHQLSMIIGNNLTISCSRKRNRNGFINQIFEEPQHKLAGVTLHTALNKAQ